MITVKKGINSTNTQYTGNVAGLRALLKDLFGIDSVDRAFVDGVERDEAFEVTDGMEISFQNTRAVCEKGAVSCTYKEHSITGNYGGHNLDGFLDTLEEVFGFAGIREEGRLKIELNGNETDEFEEVENEEGDHDSECIILDNDDEVVLSEIPVTTRAAAGTVQVSYGINSTSLSTLVGQTVQEAFHGVKALLQLADVNHLKPSVNGSEARWDKVLGGGDVLVFTNTESVCEKGILA